MGGDCATRCLGDEMADAQGVNRDGALLARAYGQRPGLESPG